jgi:hypothetical protein
MLAKVATHMSTRRTTLGFDPAALRMRVAVMTSSLVLERTAAMVKPPMRSIMVGENIWEKMYLIGVLSAWFFQLILSRQRFRRKRLARLTLLHLRRRGGRLLRPTNGGRGGERRAEEQPAR